MESKEFIEKFAETIEVEDAAGLTMDTEFRELDEWSSLAGLSVIAMFDEEFGVELNIPDFKAAKTIADLFKLAQ